MAAMGKDEKCLAPESAQTRRAREKLMKICAEEKQRMTPAALKDTVGKIHQWIADHAKDRVLVKDKGIRLFNQDKDAAAVSKKVERFAEKLKIDMQHIFR